MNGTKIGLKKRGRSVTHVVVDPYCTVLVAYYHPTM